MARIDAPGALCRRPVQPIASPMVVRPRGPAQPRWFDPLRRLQHNRGRAGCTARAQGDESDAGIRSSSAAAPRIGGRRRGDRRPPASARARLPVAQHPGRHSDRPRRRRRPSRPRVRRLLGTAAQDQLRVRLLRRRGWPGRLRGVPQPPREGRPQSAVREHGARDAHVRTAAAALSLSRPLSVFLSAGRGRQHRLRARPEPVSEDRGPRHRGEAALRHRRGQPTSASGVDRRARPRRRDQGQVQPGAIRGWQPDDGSR